MKPNLLKVLFATIFATSLLPITSAKAQPNSHEKNIALHSKVTVTPKATAVNGSADPQQLTDGIYATTGGAWSTENQNLPLWQQPGTLQWRVKGKAIITIDLGSVQPISGVIYSTEAGGESKEGWGITWPQSIYIATSDDNKTWHYVGDLVQLSQKNGTPPAKGDAAFRYVANDLKTHGRYISLGIVGYPYIFADEVEVLRGDDDLLKLPAGTPTASMETFVLQNQITDKAKQRQTQDIESIRAILKKSDIPANAKSTFEAALSKDATATKAMPLQPTDFKTIIPLTPTHRDILAIYGEVLKAQGFKPLTIWKKHRYAWLDLISKPEQKLPVSFDLSMLKNEIRSDAILLTNATDKPMTINVQPPKVLLGALQLSHAIWTDTVNNLPVQSALFPLQKDDNGYSFEIPAGVTSKIWVTINSSKIPAGTYKSTFTISANNEKTEVPVAVEIAKIAMQRPRLSLSMWDGGIIPQNLVNPNNAQAAVAMMTSHFVDTPESVLGRMINFKPTAADFDKNNQLKPGTKIDFSKFDAWIKQWPNARYFLIYHPVGSNYTFGDTKIGTPEFNARYGNFIKFIGEHAKTLGAEPSQLLFCFKDETHDDVSDQIVINMTIAVKSVDAGVTVFSNPQWADPSQAKDQRAFTLPDILCISARPNTMDFYEKIRREHGIQLWFYTTPPGVHAMNPQSFYRAYAWTTFAQHGSGMGWWSFTDARAETSWNAYNTAYGGYAPAFLDKTNVYNSVHWDAVREGVEDFEVLSMLSDAIKKSDNQEMKQQAQKVLDEAVATVGKGYSKDRWSIQLDPFVVDQQLAKVRMDLAKMDQK